MTIITWMDCDGKSLSCDKKSYDKIYKQAANQIISANDHDIEQEVDKLQNKEKKVDDIANSNEEEIKKQKEKDETKKANMKLSKEELDEILESLRADLEELKNPKDKETKEASTIKSEFIGVSNSDINTSRDSEYSVLSLDQHDNSEIGDSLLILMGSKSESTKEIQELMSF